MSDENNFGTVGFIVICVMAWYLWSQHSNIVKLQGALSEANYNIDAANSNIEEANTTIEDLNTQIEDAKGNAWSDYDAMGQALDGLSTGDTVETVSEVSDPTQK